MNALSSLLPQSLVRRTPVILQTEAAECGLACLLILAGHYGLHVDLPSARRHFALSINGMTLADLIQLARRFGLSTRAVAIDIDELGSLRLPCILHWEHNHFVVLTTVRMRGIVIHDPAQGRRFIPTVEVKKKLTGVALEAWPAPEFRKRDERLTLHVSDLVKRTAGFGQAALQVISVSMFLEIIGIAMPVGLQIVLDEVIVARDGDLLLLVTIGLACLLIAQAIVGYIRAWSILVLSSNLAFQWKLGLFDRLMRLPLEFFEKRHVGDIVSRFGSLDQIQQTLTRHALMAIIDGTMATILLAMMALYGGWLVFIVIAAVSAVLVLRTATYGMYKDRSEEAITHAAHESSHFMESVRGISSVKALCLEDPRRSAWLNHLAARVRADARVGKLDAAFSTMGGVFLGADRIILIYFGALATMANSISVGMLVAFLAFRDQFTRRIYGLVDAIMTIRMLSLHGQRVADIALYETEEEDQRATHATCTSTSHAPPAAASLSLRNITFRYADNMPYILQDISIDITAGECVAITGPSGAGKSTLLKIAAGLIRPSQGDVLFDGVDISAIGRETYRGQIACVLQNDRLFTGSIAENITGFDEKIDMERLRESARMAAIHDEILSLPMGYETFVGDMGSSLSGGQVQRVIIARALYRRPRILIMDEATSQLDDDNEAWINKSIRKLNITRIIVAHRRSSLDMADRIISLT